MARSTGLFVLALVAGALASPLQSPLALARTRAVEVRRYNVTSQAQGMDLLRLAKHSNADVWAATPSFIDMVLPPAHDSTMDSMAYTAVTHDIPIGNMSSTNFKPKIWGLEDLAQTTFHSSYHQLSEIIDFANELASVFPHYVELVRLGQSSEDREILAIRIGRGTPRKFKPRIVIQGAQHARDWIATSAALHFAHALVVSSGQHFSQNKLLEQFDFTIIPVPNPDGYTFTWDEDRLWYKNRTPVEQNDRCVGIDMNRNWGHHWESSDDPCHFWYGGAHPFEAPETNAIASYIERTPNIHSLIDLRSYGQLLMYPYSHSCDAIPANAEDLIEAALGAAKASKHVHGTEIRTGSACNLLYSAPGNIIDWSHSVAKIRFPYSLSLRDTGTYGFLLPPKWIRPVGEETGVLIQYLSEWMHKRKM